MEFRREAPALQETSGKYKRQLETIIASTDFTLINELLQHQQKRSGVSTMRAVSKEDIYIVDSFKNDPQYAEAASFSVAYAVDGKMYISAADFLSAETTMKSPERALFLILSVIFHESLHLVSFETVTSSTNGNAQTQLNYSGLLEQIRTYKGAELTEYVAKARAINEGFTQLMALRLTTEYLRRKGMTSIISKQPSGFSYDIPRAPYGVEQYLLLVLIPLLAKSHGVSETQIFQGLLHSYFNHDMSSYGNLVEFLSSILDDKNSLASPTSKAHLKRLLSDSRDLITPKETDAILRELYADFDHRDAAREKANETLYSWHKTSDALAEAMSLQRTPIGNLKASKD